MLGCSALLKSTLALKPTSCASRAFRYQTQHSWSELSYFSGKILCKPAGSSIRALSGFCSMNDQERTSQQSRTEAENATASALPGMPIRNKHFVDVHAHLIHDKFAGKEHAIAQKCFDAGLEFIVVNGLEPVSNRAILDYCAQYRANDFSTGFNALRVSDVDRLHSNGIGSSANDSLEPTTVASSYFSPSSLSPSSLDPPLLQPAIGIYPLDAACNVITSESWPHDFPPPKKFDVDAEVDFIDAMASEGRIVAIGECGLDRHYLRDPESLAEQERVLRKLMQVAKKHDLPLILHSRKAEKRVFDLLVEEGVRKADFHCFGGKVKLGAKIAAAGYYLSIPSHAIREDSSFRKLVQALPFDRILTETDSPFMGPVRGETNDPSSVCGTVPIIAAIKGVSEEDAARTIRENFRTLFGF